MAATDYSSWSVARLRKEQEKIEKAIQSREGQERSKAVDAIKRAAKESGYELQDLLAEVGIGSGAKRGPATGKRSTKKKAAARKKTGKVAPKYRNPEDSSLTWSGRGRRPHWVADYEKKHGSLDGVTIK